MNAQSRLFTSFMVLCVFSQASWVQGQAFPRVRFLKTIGDKTNEIKAHLIVTEGSIQVRDSQFSRTLKEIPYSEIKAATYSFSKHRRWRAGVAAAVAVNMFAAPLFFMKGKKHWLTFETEEDRLALRLDKSNFKDILSAVDRRLKDTVAFDGYREGASRIDTPSLENKGESTQDIERMITPPLAQGNSQSLGIEGERLILPRASYAQHQNKLYAKIPRKLRQGITTYLTDLPNFVCDYTERHYKPGIVSEWVPVDMNQGEVRYIDGRSDYRVMSGSGKLTGETIWEVTKTSPNSFGAIRNFLVPSANYRFTPQGEGAFSFQSDWGQGLVPGYTRDGTPLEGGRSYPSWGTVRVQKPEHRVLSVREYFEVPKRGWLARTFTSGFQPGEYAWFTEYGFVNIEEQPYWLVKQVELMRPSSTNRVIQTYDNCRRFGSDFSIRYGEMATVDVSIQYDEVATAQPDSRLAPAGMGDEPPTPTPALETGLEVDEDLDSGRSSNILTHVPPATPEPPLSKAVQASPSEDPPTPWLSRDGYQDPIVPSQTASRSPLKRYGYGTVSPSSEEDREFHVTDYMIYRDPVPPPEDERVPIQKDPADDRSGFWWVLVVMAGAFVAAFAGSFFGNSLRGKAK